MILGFSQIWFEVYPEAPKQDKHTHVLIHFLSSKHPKSVQKKQKIAISKSQNLRCKNMEGYCNIASIILYLKNHSKSKNLGTQDVSSRHLEVLGRGCWGGHSAHFMTSAKIGAGNLGSIEEFAGAMANLVQWFLAFSMPFFWWWFSIHQGGHQQSWCFLSTTHHKKIDGIRLGNAYSNLVQSAFRFCS